MINSSDLSRLISQIVSQVKPILLEMDASAVEVKPSPTSWSKKEILGHLIDSAINNHRRFKVSIHQAHLVFDGYTQDDEVLLHDYQNRQWSSIANLFIEMNLHIVSLLMNMKDEDLNELNDQHNYDRIGFQRINSSESTTLAYLVLDYISHLEHHIGQIISNYENVLRSYSNDPLAVEF